MVYDPNLFSIFRDPDGSCHHLKVKKGSLSRYILAPGPPERVHAIAQKLESPIELANNRGILCVKGQYQGVEITALSTGMGPASVSIVLPEVLSSINYSDGDRATILRLGTSGSLQPYVKAGHIVVSSGTIRDEGTTSKWLPLEYPAIAGTKVSLSALTALKTLGYELKKDAWFGVHHTKDELYCAESPNQSPLRILRGQVLSAYREGGVLASEMEFSVFSLLAEMANAKALKTGHLYHRIDAGCLLLVISGYHDDASSEAVSFQKIDQSKLIDVALETLRIKAKWDKGLYEESLADVIGDL